MTQKEPTAPPAPPRRPRRPGPLPAGLLGMLALAAGVETAVDRAGPRLVDPVGYSWRFSARAAEAEAPGADVLCLGDSLAKHGLVPRVIEAETGRRAYNLAVAAGPAPVTAAILRRALRAGARPSAVVFDLKPSLLVGGPRFALRYWPQALTPAEMTDLARSARQGAFAGELLAGAVLPSFRSRHEVRGALASAFRGEAGPLGAINAVCRRNWSVNAGANLATPSPGYSGEVTEAEHEAHLSRGFQAHRVNAEYALRVVETAEAHGARCYLVIPPSTPRLRDRRGQTGAEAKYTAFVRSLQDRHPGLTVLDARGARFPASAFVDPIHLDARGAIALSAGVAEVLRRDAGRGAGPPASKRWVDLPAFRDRALPDGVEHVELSRARLGATATR